MRRSGTVDGAVGQVGPQAAIGQLHFEVAALGDAGREAVLDPFEIIRQEVAAVAGGADADQRAVDGRDAQRAHQFLQVGRPRGTAQKDAGPEKRLP